MKNYKQSQEYEKWFNTFFLEEEDKKQLKENHQKGKENFWFVKIVFSETISAFIIITLMTIQIKQYISFLTFIIFLLFMFLFKCMYLMSV